MKSNIITIRIFFLLVSLFGCVLIWYQDGTWSLWQVLCVGMGMAALVILTDMLLEGFSLRDAAPAAAGHCCGSDAGIHHLGR